MLLLSMTALATLGHLLPLTVTLLSPVPYLPSLQGEDNTTRFEENGQVVLVTENRSLENGLRRGDIVISGTCDRLIRHLLEDRSSIDMTYDEVSISSRDRNGSHMTSLHDCCYCIMKE